MRKLLRANGSRLRRDRAFWLLAALMAALGASMAVVNAVHARQDGEIWTMDYTLFIYVILAPILASVFTALFIGNEHSSGAMRNKLIAGHRRGCIYLADLLVSCCAGICLCLAFALPQAISGLRELKILKRFRVTPVSPVFVLGVELAMYVVYCLVSLATLAAAALLWGMRLRGSLPGFLGIGLGSVLPPICVMLALTALCTLLSLRFFRWE